MPNINLSTKLDQAQVYDVDVQPPNGGKQTAVQVNATSGKVLNTEPAGDPDTDAGD